LKITDLPKGNLLYNNGIDYPHCGWQLSLPDGELVIWFDKHGEARWVYFNFIRINIDRLKKILAFL
jgi:hypothetical protein